MIMSSIESSSPPSDQGNLESDIYQLTPITIKNNATLTADISAVEFDLSDVTLNPREFAENPSDLQTRSNNDSLGENSTSSTSLHTMTR